MITNTSLASFSTAISSLRGTSAVVPRATATQMAPSVHQVPTFSGTAPASSMSPRGSLLDVSA